MRCVSSNINFNTIFLPKSLRNVSFLVRSIKNDTIALVSPGVKCKANRIGDENQLSSVHVYISGTKNTNPPPPPPNKFASSLLENTALMMVVEVDAVNFLGLKAFID